MGVLNTPKFSVIVPIYNVDRYLRDCLESILEQTYRDFELIIVNDGSTDNCAIICDEYAKKDPRVKVVHKKNDGVVSARKVGAEIACGEYVTCVDGDDWLHTQCLEYYWNIIEENPVDLIVSNIVAVSMKKDGKQKRGGGYRAAKDYIKKWI